MAEAKSRLPVGQHIDFVSIVTLNRLHFPVAKVIEELCGLHHFRPWTTAGRRRQSAPPLHQWLAVAFTRPRFPQENNFSIRAYGTRASLEWHEEYPNKIAVHLNI